MVKFDFFWPTEFIFGAGEFEKAGGKAAALGKKALLVTGGRSARRTGVYGRLLSGLEKAGVEVVPFEGIAPNPKAGSVDRGGLIAAEENCEFIIGLGGGSVMDAAKAIAAAAVHPGSIWEYMNSFKGFREITSKTLPIIEIPTVSGTGSEGNATAVISNAETLEKSYIKSRHLFPACSVIDPELVFTVPARITAASGADIVCHVLEPYINASESFETTLLMTEAFMKNVVLSLRKAVENGKDAFARSNLAWVSTLCCSPFRGLGLGGIGSLHHMEHSLSGRFNIPHGEGLCALLPSWLEFMESAAPERIERFGLSVFGERDALPAVRKWLDSIGMGLSLKDFKIGEDSIGALVSDTIRVYGKGEDFIPNGRWTLSPEDIEKIYRRAF